MKNIDPATHLAAWATAFLALAVPHFSPTASAAARDWSRFPAIVELTTKGDVYAFGDVHGDYDRMIQLLAAGKLIAANPQRPEDVRWTGGAATLVCTGDLIDKSDHALPAIVLLRALQPRAEQAGGRVVVTMGNHEAEFLASGGRSHKSSEFAGELMGAGISPADVAAGTDATGIGSWLGGLPVAAKVNDWFFCHAGNTGGRTLAALRQELERQITADGFGARILSDPNSILEARLHPRPWWESEGTDVGLHDKVATDARGEKRLKDLVEALGCGHLVIGHQPGAVEFGDGTHRDKGRIISKFGGLIYLIDTGMSRGVASGRGGLLMISGKPIGVSVEVIYTDGVSEAVTSPRKGADSDVKSRR